MTISQTFTKNQLKRIAEDLRPLGFSYTKKRAHDQVVELYEFLKSKGYDGNVDKASITNFIYDSDFTDEIMRAMDDQNPEKETQEWFQRLEPEEVPTKPAKQDRQEIYDFFQRFEPEEAPSKPSKEERRKRYEELITVNTVYNATFLSQYIVYNDIPGVFHSKFAKITRKIYCL